MDERNKIHYHTIFTIIDELPGVKEEWSYYAHVEAIDPVQLDCEQGNPEVYNYDYYRITIFETDQFTSDRDDAREEAEQQGETFDEDAYLNDNYDTWLNYIYVAIERPQDPEDESEEVDND